MDLGLKGKKAIVVGGARGIGRAAAEALLKEGVHVAIGARSADGVKATVSELQKGGGKVWVRPSMSARPTSTPPGSPLRQRRSAGSIFS